MAMRSFIRPGRVTIDGIVNLLILLTCGLVTSALTGHWPAQRVATASIDRADAIFRRGTEAEHLPGVRYDDVDATLVLYVRSTCHYCTASMPLYKRLTTEVAAHGNVRIVVTSPETVDVLGSYLKANGVAANHLVTFAGRNEATPTLLVVDKKGMIQNVWVGQQDARGENEITETLARALAGAAS